MPSSPSLQAAAYSLSPSPSACSTYWMPRPTRRSFRSAALRSTYGLRRRSSPLSIRRSKARAVAFWSFTRLCKASKSGTPSRSSQTTSASRIAAPLILVAVSTIRGKRLTPANGHVCFTPQSGHVQCTSACRLWAKSGHQFCFSKSLNVFFLRAQKRRAYLTCLCHFTALPCASV